uniref:Nucleoporin_N domain-containing protein n=1 Tax=Elaeophora elaphi TaxID=1147741 RepID=A0A158Q7J8_9BILA
MTDYLKGEELVFSATYTFQPIRVIRMSNEELHTLTNEEVEPAVGSYDFRDIPDMVDRFIIWLVLLIFFYYCIVLKAADVLVISARLMRSNRSSLLLEERSVEGCFDFASLCFNFSPINVIPGTQFSFAHDKLILIVPTQNALYRFTFEIGTLKKNEVQAVLKLSSDQTFLYNHDSYELTSSRSACRASIMHTTSNGTSALYSLSDGQVVLVQMRHVPGSRGQGYEKVIRGDGLLQRVMKAAHQLSLVVSLTSCVVHHNILFYVLFDDKRLHVYMNGKKEYDGNLHDIMIHHSDGGDAEQVTVEMVKTCSNADSFYVIVLSQVDDHCMFILGKIDPYLLPERAGYFSFINAFQTESGVVDFTCAVQEDILDIICLCKVSDGIRYCLRTASIDCLNGVLTVPWKGTNEIHGGDLEVSVLQAKSKQSVAAQKSCIFDPNRYPFGVVLRSLQLVCKKGTFNWELLSKRQDWRMLKEAAEQYCGSVEFDQHYVTREDRSLLATTPPNQAGQDRFWTTLTKMCNELMQNECLSLGLWHSVPLGLYGTIQQGRFTVCRPGDEQLHWFERLIGNDEKNVKLCWEVITKFAAGGLVASAISIEESEQFVNAFSTVSHVFEDAIRKFTELRPVDEFDLGTAAEVPFHGSFTIGLLATHFVRLIDDRLALSQCFIALMELVKTVYSSQDEAIPLDARWGLTVNTHEKSLHDMNRQFSILSQTMKLRISLDNYSDISLADGFFATAGLPTILSYVQDKELVGEEDDTEEDEEETIEDRADNCDEKIPHVSPLRQSTSAYSQFLNRIVNDAVVVLWPENTAMVLARFLANYHQYTALQAYCQLNEPYITELCAAFRFFEGCALAGLRDPEKALQSFLDALEGINRQDEALNRMLSRDGNVSDEPYSELQYLLKVMAVMELHGFHEQLVYLSRRALKEALQTKQSTVLPGLYTSVFKFELITERYDDALNTLLSNPVPENRRICLRELLVKLIEQRKNAVLVGLNYENMEQQVIDILKANARTSDISKEGYFYELIYAFHMKRDLYQRAALTMFEYSCRLQSELQNRDVLSRRCGALSIVVSLLSLLPQSDQFLTLPASLGKNKDLEEQIEETDERVQEKVERRLGKNALTVWTLNDILKTAALSSARLVLFDVNYNPKEKKSIPPPVKFGEIFEQLVQKKLFDHAWEINKVFDLKPYPLLKAVTMECIHLDAKPPKGEPYWVAKNRKFVKKVPSLRDRHWAILRGYMEVAMKKHIEDFKILWTVTFVFLENQWHIPPWLSNCYEERCAAQYAYLLIMFDHLHLASETLKKKIVSETMKITSQTSQCSIPVTEVDWLLWLISKKDDVTLKEHHQQS